MVQKFIEGRNDSMVVEMEFQVHSELYDILNSGIELDIILADNGNFEQAESIDRLKNVQFKLKEGGKHIKKGIDTQQAKTKGVGIAADGKIGEKF